MTSRCKGVGGWDFCDDVWRGTELEISWRHKTLVILHSQYDSVQTWLDFTVLGHSPAIDELVKGGLSSLQ